MELGTKHRWPKGLALPALPTTPEAYHYFFSKICEYSILASTTGKGRIDYQMIAQEWSWSADGITHFYITTEVLYAYAKTWEKINNIHQRSLFLTKWRSQGEPSRKVVKYLQLLILYSLPFLLGHKILCIQDGKSFFPTYSSITFYWTCNLTCPNYIVAIYIYHFIFDIKNIISVTSIHYK